MTGRRRWAAVAVATCAVAAATTTGWVGWAAPGSGGEPGDRAGDGLRLVVATVDSGRETTLHERPVREGEEFVLRHTHSVTRRPVTETFTVVRPAGVAVTELRFDEFGPNLPAGPETVDGVTSTFTHHDGEYRVRYADRRLPAVPLRVGSPSVDHVLTFDDGDRLRLLEVAAAGAHVELRVIGGG